MIDATTNPGSGPRLSLFAILIWNVLLWGAAGWLLGDRLILSSCVPAPVRFATAGLVGIAFMHALWHSSRALIARLRVKAAAGPLELAPEGLGESFEQIHPRRWSERTLWALFILAVIAWAFLSGPYSPLLAAEPVPLFQGFAVETRSYRPGEVLEVRADQQVLIEAQGVDPGCACTWIPVAGKLSPAKGCATLYRYAGSEAVDSLALLLSSPCATQKSASALHIRILPGSPPRSQ